MFSQLFDDLLTLLMVAFAIQAVLVIEGQAQCLVLRRTKKNRTNLSLLSWNVQSIEARRVGSVTTAPDDNRDLDSRFGPDEKL